jgi:hypothetical protein
MTFGSFGVDSSMFPSSSSGTACLTPGNMSAQFSLTKFGFTTSKKKKTDDHDDEKKEKKKQYETKRERNFQENWADEFPGVRHAVSDLYWSRHSQPMSTIRSIEEI